MSVRVRYAPSPTGSPHVGNIRTALYNHLFAKRHGGTNILRIEDTDRARAVEGCEADIVESMRYVGIEWQEGVGAARVATHPDFGPYRQSERKEAGIYEPHWRKLLEDGSAYWAFDTEDELKEMRQHQEANKLATGYFGGAWRDATPAQVDEALKAGKPGVVRLRMPKGETIVVEDAVRGRIQYDSDNLDDPVLIKSDGMPTYHFAAMVDDHLMEITHIFRGEEWISSAPKHVTLFKALGWTPPIMVHLPVINGKDGKKLSKRHGDTACLDFRRAGFTGETIANFIALIGWSPGGDREVMTMAEMAEAFDIRGIQPSSGVFDLDKLVWMSGMHIRALEPAKLMDEAVTYAEREETTGYWEERVPVVGESDPRTKLEGLNLLAQSSHDRPDYTLEALKLVQDRVHNLSDLGEASAFFFEDDVEYDPKAVKKWFPEPHTARLFDLLITEIERQPAMSSPGDYEKLLRDAQTHLGLEKLGPVVHPTRVALTGKTAGPGLFELMAVLGPVRVANRLKLAAQSVK